MKKILHLVWSLKLAGAERVAHTLLTAARAAGYEPWVSAFVPSDPDDAKPWEQEGIRTVVFSKRDGFDIYFPFRLRSLLRDKQIDLIHTHNAVGALYGGLARPSDIFHVHTEHSNLPAGKRILRKLAARMLRTAHVVADSKKVAVTLKRREGLPADQIRVIYNGVETISTGQRSTLNLREWLRIPADAQILGTAGNLRPVKNHGMLLNAFANLRGRFPSLHLVILGEGTERPRLEKLALELGIQAGAHFPGFRSDVQGLLAQFDVFALTSRSEGLPLSLLEAMAAGRPCVSTSVGGVPEVLRDGENGLLIPSESVEALVRATTQLFEDPKSAARLGNTGRETVRIDFDQRKMADGYVALYRELL